MEKLICKLFGVPRIQGDGKSIFLPYAKTSALLYYLLVSKEASRDRVTSLLWPGDEEAAAKKNLRNALYQLKKTLGADVIVSPEKSILTLNSAITIETDVDRFLSHPQENVDLYTGEFLQGFYLKDTEPFEFWISNSRILYAEKFSSECYRRAEAALESGRYEGVEHDIQRLIAIDEYDERYYRLLMRYYQGTGCNSKVIETYYDLTRLLQNELGIQPDQSTKEVYESALVQFNVDKETAKKKDSFFFGRYQEIASMEKAFKAFYRDSNAPSILIRGDLGSGKSTMMKTVLDGAEGVFALDVECFRTERDMSLRPWCRIAQKIAEQTQRDQLLPSALWKNMMTRFFPDFKSNLPDARFVSARKSIPLDVLVHALSEALRRMAEQRCVVLAVENLQWMDEDSLRVLTALLLELSSCRVKLVATCDCESDPVLEDALFTLRSADRLTTVALEPFDIEACHHFIEKALAGEEVRGEILEHIYNEAEGNALLLREYTGLLRTNAPLSTLTEAMRTAFESRLAYLPPRERQTLNLLSLFNGGATVCSLAELSSMSKTEMLESLTLLKNRYLVKETGSGRDSSYHFRHHRLREYCYSQLSDSYRLTWHERIALMLESQLGDAHDIRAYSRIIYHFSAIGDYLKVLRYRMATLSDLLSFGHEMFPVLDDVSGGQDPKHYVPRDQINEMLNHLEAEFEKLENAPSDTLERLKLEFHYLKGRHLIRDGRYEEGVDSIMIVIGKSQQLELWQYTLECYKQMMCYYIQVDDSHGMAHYVDLALELAIRCNYYKEIGIILRFKGWYEVMVGEYALAEKYLKDSIRTLSLTDSVATQYAANIAAAYDYIGESQAAQGDLLSALWNFNKAISLCSGKNVLSSLSVFYINAGKISYYLGELKAAKEYFDKAYSLYGQFESFWRRSILDSYMALVIVKNGQYAEALHYLVSARENIANLRSPSDRGAVHFAEALISKASEGNSELAKVFDRILSEAPDYYYQNALRDLSRNVDRYEIRVLKDAFSEGT